MVTAQQAPAVVAVMVTCDPGPWLEEALAALAAQDYPNLSVLVIDAGSAEDPTSRVAAVLPGAYVRRLPVNPGYAAAANEALEAVEGSCHLLFCHDDVAPEPDAVRLLVEEAFRSNAAVVTPKLVDWNDPTRLLQVGMGADKSGAPAPLVEPGELDQEQHDAVRDVFVAPGACNLVRADLFRSLGGFDREMFLFGEDLDFSWRAQVAGARVLVAPAARVRHLEAMSSGKRAPGGGAPPANLATLRSQVRTYQLRHRLRAVLKAYGPWHLIRVLPQVMALAVVEVIFGLLSGHTRTAGDTVGAWSWNLRRLGELRRARRAVRAYRGVGDGEVRRLQARGSARLSGFIRGQLARERVQRRTRGVLDRPRAVMRAGILGHSRLPLVVGGVVALVLVVGSRHLVTGGIPAVHEFAPFPRGAFSLLGSFLSGWRQTGLGSDGPAPLALGLLGLGGIALAGATGLLQTVLVLGALPAGAIGAFRLATPFGSRLARVAAMLVYVAVPLPYNALARGRWSVLLVYAAAPWIMARLMAATAIQPVADVDTRAGTDRRRRPRGDVDRRAGGSLSAAAGRDRIGGEWLRRHVLPLALMVALLAAFVPAVLGVVMLVAVALVLGSFLVGDLVRSLRAVLAATGASLVAAVLLFPWSLDFILPGTQVSSLLGMTRTAAVGPGLGELLRFEMGPLGAPPIGWAFLVAAALPLIVGRGWRLAWAGRLWIVALSCWGVAWAGGRGWLPVEVAPPDMLLAPAAVAMAMAVALGMVAFEIDLPGYRFGWRQLASTTALVATLAATVPVVAAAMGGRWNVPDTDFARLLSWMPEQRARGAFRVLWIGDPEALPLGSWRLADGVGYATSEEGPPDATMLWPGASPGAAELVADAVGLARANGTTSLGHLLAPTAIRYVVVPLRAAPDPDDAPLLAPPPDLRLALEAQVDLKKLEGEGSVLVYENAAWIPARAVLDEVGAEASGRTSLVDLRDTDLAGAVPALPRRRSPTRFSGRLASGNQVLLSEASSSNWEMRVAGHGAPRSKAFGWANVFTSPATGQATLRYRTPLVRYVAVAIEVGLWIGIVRAIRGRRERRT